MGEKKTIEFDHYTFQYYTQASPTLIDINLQIKSGEKILIVGPSGSGKSTLGHCLNGLIPSAYRGKVIGRLMINEKEAFNQSIYDLSKQVGTVLQDSDGQFVGLTVGEDIAFVMENDQVKTEEMVERVKKVAKMVSMDHLLGSSPFELSGGQKQRTSLAGVMINDVDILLFDEPLANLDPATGKSAIEIIDDIHKATNKTIVIIEHRLEDVLHRPIDRIILIDEGQIIADMPPHEMIASNLLINHGIREPLYVSAMKYAGIKINEAMCAGYISSVQLLENNEAILQWNKSLKDIIHPKKEKLIIEIDHICFSYDGKRPILEDINFNVSEGEMIAIVGKNGAGKSTLAKLLCGFEKEDSGTIKYEGDDISPLSIMERAKKIGYVMQNPNQMITKNLIFDEVALGLRHRGMGEEEIVKKVTKVLTICGLSPFVEWPISALSYGQKKRVTIATILALDPKVIILDEPTAGQDYKHYSEIMSFLEGINKLGITIIMITHDMHLMLEYAHRSIVLSEGKKIADTTAANVLTDSFVIEAANLKETSLFTLAQKVGIGDPTMFVQRFIDYERQEVGDK